MKKGIIFMLILLSTVMSVQAQRNGIQKLPATGVEGLKVEVRIHKAHIAVKELKDPVSMFNFKLFTPSFPAGNVNGDPAQVTANCQFHPLTDFKVVYKETAATYLNGDLVYNFVYTGGVNTETLYGVDVIPKTNILTPAIGYVLTKTGQAQDGYCIYSTMKGKTLKIDISAVYPPK
jgi:hypothetical protein